MSAKHRKATKLAAKRSAIAATAIGATAGISLMGAPAQAAAATTAPNYTQIISDYSHSLDNFLLGAGNLGGAAGNAWNPIASQVPLGLLPTFTAKTTQQDLTSVSGLITAVTEVLQSPVPTTIPGLPTGNTIPGIGSVPGINEALGVIGGQLVAAQSVLNYLNYLNTLIEALPGDIPLISGIPTLEQLIPGLEATRTAFTSGYSWLGMDGSTSVSNLFATLPSLTGASLVNGIVSGLGVPAIPGIDLPAVIAAAVTPLNVLATPSVTAWLPSASGLYDLPLGGSMGWFGTMPTLALGPVSLLGQELSTSDTVVAIPVGGFGLNAPLNLFQTGFISTPGLVLPTATGVTTIGGTTIGQFNIPLLPTPALYANTLQSTYFGTNGFHVNTGQSALTLPGLPVPLVYSMGSFNLGTTGMGFTLPSVFGVGLLPSFQVGTAPGQTSPDGLLPAALLNAVGPSLLPTQLTSVTQLLGLPDFMGQAGTFLTPVYTGLVTPALTPLSDFATQQYGPFLNDSAANLLKLSTTFKDTAGTIADALPSTAESTTAAAGTTSTARTMATEQTTTPQTVVNDEETTVVNTDNVTDDNKVAEENTDKTPVGAHDASLPGMESFDALKARLSGDKPDGDSTGAGDTPAPDPIEAGDDKPVVPEATDETPAEDPGEADADAGSDDAADTTTGTDTAAA